MECLAVIANLDEERVRQKIALLESAHPIFAWLIEKLSEHPLSFKINPELYGLDLSPDSSEERTDRRAVKFFLHGKERLAVFFYKRSLMPYSRNRFAYGSLYRHLAELSEADLNVWLDYLLSGFPVDRKPAGLRRSLYLDIPE